MPLNYTYTSSFPHHATYRINGKEIDICAAEGDTVSLPDGSEDNMSISNLVQTGVLVKIEVVKEITKKQPEKK